MILGKRIKIVATRYHILKLKCTKFDFDWGSTPEPTGGAHSTPPDPLAGIKTNSKERGEIEKQKGEREEEERGKGFPFPLSSSSVGGGWTPLKWLALSAAFDCRQ